MHRGNAKRKALVERGRKELSSSEFYKNVMGNQAFCSIIKRYLFTPNNCEKHWELTLSLVHFTG